MILDRVVGQKPAQGRGEFLPPCRRGMSSGMFVIMHCSPELSYIRDRPLDSGDLRDLLKEFRRMGYVLRRFLITDAEPESRRGR